MLSGQPTLPVYAKFGSKNVEPNWDKLPSAEYDFTSYNCNSKMIKIKNKWYYEEEYYVVGDKMIIHYIKSGDPSSLYPIYYGGNL